jgi:ribosomal protein S18 acetylase RimI-like enzyme
MSIALRQFCYPDDYQAVIHLWQNAGAGIHVRRSDQPAEIEKKLLRDPDLFLVALDGEQVIGSVLGGYDGRRGMVYHLAVADRYRQQGIGSALMEELEQRLKDKGCIRSYLLVTTENTDAMRFYDHRGWERMELHIFGKDL